MSGWLVLSRHAGESLVFLKDGKVLAEVKVNEIHSGKVKLAVQAESYVTVLRDELVKRGAA